MSKKKGLGRGLGALLSESSLDKMIDEKDYVEDLDLDRVIANEDQPRKTFTEESLEALSESIKTHGLIQPIIVRQKGTEYEIIAGERRYRACKMAGKKTIKAIVKDMDDLEVKKVALIENIQREDLSLEEEALAYKSLLEEYGLTHQELSQAVGKSRTYISNTLRLLKLDKETLDLVEAGSISRSHARALLPLEEEDRENIIKEIIEDKINVREVEKKVKKTKNATKAQKSQKSDDIFIKDLEEELMDLFGTKVKIKSKSQGGSLEIDFYNSDDLNRLIEILRGM